MIVQAKGFVPAEVGMQMCVRLLVNVIVLDAEKGIIDASDRDTALKIVNYLKRNGYPYATIDEDPKGQ